MPSMQRNLQTAKEGVAEEPGPEPATHVAVDRQVLPKALNT